MSAYVTNALRFTDEAAEVDCQGPSDGRCVAADGEPAFAIHTVTVRYMNNETRHLCAIHSPFSNIYVPCGKCHTKPAIGDERPEVDPLCDDCIRETITEVAASAFAPGQRKLVVCCITCKGTFHAAKLYDRVCPDCLADDECEEDVDAGACAGFGEYCGNNVSPGNDLCGDCTLARLDVESPRFPR